MANMKKFAQYLDTLHITGNVVLVCDSSVLLQKPLVILILLQS